MEGKRPLAVRAVIFDLGGVVLGSPLRAIADYERERGIEPGLVNRVVVESGPSGAWARLERGEIDLERFHRDFDRECAAAGAALSSRELFARMAEAAQPHPAMVRALGELRRAGLATAALTNNWAGDGDRLAPIRDAFDVFVESSRVGLRKPDPGIYRLALDLLEVEPAQAVFLDDIGRNLKPARALGMATIKVDDPVEALGALGRLLGLELARARAPRG